MTIYGRSEELVSRCVECDLAEPEPLASLGGSAPGFFDGILSNTKESWHEVALKFRVIADDRGYDDIIEGIVTPPDEKEDLEILVEDNAEGKKAKKEKQLARAAKKRV